MLQNRRSLVIALVVVAGLALFLYVMGERANEPASSQILKARDAFARSLAQDRTPKGAVADPAERLEDLDHRLATAYLSENLPAKAVDVLKRLIRDEEGKTAAGAQRSSRSYRKLSQYYEDLAEAYELMRNDGDAMSAKNKRIEMLSKAEEAKRREALKEGRSVGRGAE